MIEIWKDIEGYEGLYQVSSLGKVKSLERVVKNSRYGDMVLKEKILKPRKTKDGYYQVNLCKDGKMRNYLIHRLVALAFIDNTHNYQEVNHIDEVKTNNCVENLEWCDRQYNVTYNNIHNRIAEKRKKIILCYNLKNEFIKEFSSLIEASIELFGEVKYRANISENLRNKNKTCKGYKFKYKQ